MLNKLKFSVRVQFIIVAVSLFFITMLLGMTAYLWDAGEYQASFYVIQQGDVYIGFTDTAPKNKLVEKGRATKFSPTILNKGRIDSYLFVKLEIDNDKFQLESMDEHLRTLSSNDNVYYYGTDANLDNFPPSGKCKVCEAITVTAKEGTSFNLSVKAYAIQTVGYEDSTPQDVWKDVKDKI